MNAEKLTYSVENLKLKPPNHNKLWAWIHDWVQYGYKNIKFMLKIHVKFMCTKYVEFMCTKYVEFMFTKYVEFMCTK